MCVCVCAFVSFVQLSDRMANNVGGGGDGNVIRERVVCGVSLTFRSTPVNRWVHTVIIVIGCRREIAMPCVVVRSVTGSMDSVC